MCEGCKCFDEVSYEWKIWLPRWMWNAVGVALHGRRFHHKWIIRIFWAFDESFAKANDTWVWINLFCHGKFLLVRNCRPATMQNWPGEILCLQQSRHFFPQAWMKSEKNARNDKPGNLQVFPTNFHYSLDFPASLSPIAIIQLPMTFSFFSF